MKSRARCWEIPSWAIARAVALKPHPEEPGLLGWVPTWVLALLVALSLAFAMLGTFYLGLG